MPWEKNQGEKNMEEGGEEEEKGAVTDERETPALSLLPTL
jgi:hypothetical protein